MHENTRVSGISMFNFAITQKTPVFRLGFSTCLMPGSSLLSHGETPHYHRRYGVSLLSSAWGQVGPPRYCRQANSVSSTPHHVINGSAIHHSSPREPISEHR